VKAIAKRVWEEPAVAIGLLTSIALVVLNLLGDDTDTINWIEVAAPLLAALGIRPLVTPNQRVEEAMEMKVPAQPLPPPPTGGEVNPATKLPSKD
jgi:hypothetical protein